MSIDRRLHIETFRVYTDDVLSRPEVHRGVAVVSFWNNGMPARFLDFLMNPDETDAASTYKGNLAYKLDDQDPPEVVDGKVFEMGLDANLYGGNFSTNLFFPNQVFSKKGRQTGRFALACLKDNSPESVKNRRAANIVRLNSAQEVQTLPSPHRGSSVLLINEQSPVIIRDGGNQKVFRHTKYALRYDSRTGLNVSEYEERDEPLDWPDFGGDKGGSDREPRNPIVPLHSGSVEVEPDELEVVEAYPPREA
jgi:hypothetical protein